MEIIGDSSKMQIIHTMIQDAAGAKANVLIIGESGTGKELVARAIHKLSSRKGNPFIVVHCGSYTHSLTTSELFGHEKGAFTGATLRTVGRFEKAHKGTIFLDEIGSISQETQVMLLRVLEEKRFERVGGGKTIEVDIRILAATNKNLSAEVAEGRFRDDLYYRLNVINICLPPLMERKEDIPLLVEFFLKKYNRIEGKNIQGISTKAMDFLINYNWPGNVRELKNEIHRAVIFTKEDTIREDFLLLDSWDKAFRKGTSLVDHERQLIWSTLQKCRWNKHEVARRLGINRSTLYNKIRRYGLIPQRGIGSTSDIVIEKRSRIGKSSKVVEISLIKKATT